MNCAAGICQKDSSEAPARLGFTIEYCSPHCATLFTTHSLWIIRHQLYHLQKLTNLTAAPWARAANFVKKPPLIANDTFLELNGFNASMLVSWSPSDPKKLQCIDRCIQILQICLNKQEYDIHIKFEVSLHFWPIWPTVCRSTEIGKNIKPCFTKRPNQNWSC